METFPLIIEKNNFRIGLLNYTYSTNGITVPDGNIVNLINEEDIMADIKLTKSYLVDKIVVFVHWGLEYEQNPSADQIKLQRFVLRLAPICYWIASPCASADGKYI